MWIFIELYYLWKLILTFHIIKGYNTMGVLYLHHSPIYWRITPFTSIIGSIWLFFYSTSFVTIIIIFIIGTILVCITLPLSHLIYAPLYEPCTQTCHIIWIQATLKFLAPPLEPNPLSNESPHTKANISQNKRSCN